MWLVFESSISFLEMLTSCYFAFRIFGRVFENRKEILYLVLFSFLGTALLTIRETGILNYPDFVPALVTVGIYVWSRCCAKWWSAVFWSLVSYFLVGVVSIIVGSGLRIILDVPMNDLQIQESERVIACVLVRLCHLLLMEAILHTIKRFQKRNFVHQSAKGMILLVSVSIAVLLVLLRNLFFLEKDFVLYLNIFTCILILTINFSFLFFKEILSQERSANKELAETNRIIQMQVRNQAEISEMYQNMRALKHDMNNHLHTISGYIQLGEGENARRYIEKIAGEISRTDIVQTGNPGIDALLAVKGAVARSHDIKLQVDVNLPEALYISEEHLAIVLGNLYDNAVDANLKVQEKSKRFIQIDIDYQAQALTIYFQNASVGEDRDANYHWITTKHEKGQHGYGLKNIDRIVAIYDGHCIREQKNQVFQCQIRIPNEEK